MNPSGRMGEPTSGGEGPGTTILPLVICLVGPTGVGKSEVALDLAERLGAEIVCADSRQIYRGLDIGTAKPGPSERMRVPHHLLDLVDPDEAYSAGRYARDGAECLAALHARGRRALVTGGTGLYVRALLWGLCDGPCADRDLRDRWLAREREERGTVYRRLSDVDPESAAAIHPNDLPKALRAIEVFELTGARLSAMQRVHGFRAPRYEAVVVGLRRAREDLYRRVDARVDAMLGAGLLAEVRELGRRGFGADAPGMRAVGYRQIVGALEGAYGMDEAIRLIKRDTRQYAKRQMTWFGADPAVRWVDVAADDPPSAVISRVLARVENAVGVA